ncbi:DUF3850 domain-containing protein [Lactococcus lactis]|nr:DUF3850 domain-containing protein [Lactococcus lactis]
MTIHELKLDDNYFNDVEKGKKKFEIRKNDIVLVLVLV